ncbi:hypothetical protein CPB84DRAFT_328631 [Gymnopilus junonius]|uniref:Uncharacterized protein n=1 Tax=Gymnopilus junonius TaxID=109634 RepID=A0A9P5NC14_GYMJU|nr:hypothetical protein CPB84DRAFT_328631 [Gymnopilus junonius]
MIPEPHSLKNFVRSFPTVPFLWKSMFGFVLWAAVKMNILSPRCCPKCAGASVICMIHFLPAFPRLTDIFIGAQVMTICPFFHLLRPLTVWDSNCFMRMRFLSFTSNCSLLDITSNFRPRVALWRTPKQSSHWISSAMKSLSVWMRVYGPGKGATLSSH